MQDRNRRERGAVLASTAVWMIALLAITAIAVEVARLTTTATEVQVAADAAALGAAVAIGQPTPPSADAWGKAVAAANYADGRAIDTNKVLIDVGNYNSDPAASPHFTTGCTPFVDCNAARATVTVENVNYIMASIFGGQTGTSVTKTAVAAVECEGGGSPLPLAICDSALSSIPQNNTCGPMSSSIQIQPSSTQNGCWTILQIGSVASSGVINIFPAQCGGTPVYTSLGQDISVKNGLADDVLKALQCCMLCDNMQDFLVPVIHCTGSCGGVSTVIGFATMHITGVSRNTNGNTHCPCGDVINGGSEQITGSQICKSEVAGAPGGTNCTNFGTTVAPVMGQLP